MPTLNSAVAARSIGMVFMVLLLMFKAQREAGNVQRDRRSLRQRAPCCRITPTDGRRMALGHGAHSEEFHTATKLHQNQKLCVLCASVVIFALSQAAQR